MKEILNSHPVANLKKEISKTNIKNYSKLKKAELVSLMMKHKDRFDHIKKYEKNPKAEKKLKKSAVEVEKKTKAKPTMNQKELNAIMNKGGAKLPKAEKKKKKKRLVIKPDNLKKAVGVSKYEANKMDFFDLMKMLPGDVKHNIGKQVKGDKNMDKFKELDDIVDELIGLHYETASVGNLEYYDFYNNENGGFDPFMKQMENKMDKLKVKVGKTQNKIFTTKLVKKLEDMGKNGGLKGYEYLDSVFGEDREEDDWEINIYILSESRINYFLDDELGIIREDDGYYISNNTRKKTREYAKQVERYGNDIILKMKKLL
tara:strand:- start:696 stop:1643 length:948 start_codon:yes stop_codon:yes gene_type:complete